MTWYEWLTGLAEFAVAWWATDALTSPQARAKRVAQRTRTEEVEQASYVPGDILRRHLEYIDYRRNALRVEQEDLSLHIAKLKEELLTETMKIG